MISRHHLVEIKCVKELPLSTLSLPHHGLLPRIAVSVRRNHGSPTVSTRVLQNNRSGADIACLLSNGRFTPESGHHELALPCPLSAKSGCEQSQQGRRYSITSSAATSSPGGTVRPSARSETGRQISC